MQYNIIFTYIVDNEDTKVSRSTHPNASTSQGRFGLIFDQLVLLTSMLFKNDKSKQIIIKDLKNRK